MKITAKTSEQELKDFLNANVKLVEEQDKDLHDRIIYVGKLSKTDESKVTRKDLYDLAKEVSKLLGKKAIEPKPKVENSTKKLHKPTPKEETKAEDSSDSEPSDDGDDSDETVEEQMQLEVEEPKKAKKSLGGKKKKEPKEGVTVLEGSENEKTVQLAKMFPKILQVGDNKFELTTDIKTMEDLYNALNNDEELVVAYYWTKRHLRQFSYFNGWLGQPKSFDNDLDLATVIYVSDEYKVSYQVSMYTEAVYTLLPEDLQEEDGIRIAGGSEYQIYRTVK